MLFFFVEILKQILPAIKPSDFLGQLSHLPGGALGFALNINAKASKPIKCIFSKLFEIFIN
jgi:hypothetical protein